MATAALASATMDVTHGRNRMSIRDKRDR